MNDLINSTATLSAFLEAAAARRPTPGGGAVAALVGALAASMGEMTLHYSIGKKDLKQFEPELTAALESLARCRSVLMELLVEDQQAFADYSAARKLPEGSPERHAAYPPALAAAIRVPQTIGATAMAILTIIDPLVPKVNRFLLSDLAVCADLAMATIRCASYNVKGNLPEITDRAGAEKIAQGSDDELSRGIDLIRRISPAIWARIAQP